MTLKDGPRGDLSAGYTIIQRHFLLNSSFFIFAGKCLKRFPIIRISFHTSTESSFRGIKNESTAQVMDECSFRTIHLFRWFLCYVCVLSLLEHRGKSRDVPNDRYLASYVPLVTGARFLYWLIVLLRLRLWEKATSGGLYNYVEECNSGNGNPCKQSSHPWNNKRVNAYILFLIFEMIIF